MTDFSLWLGQELDRKGWSRSEAARRGGISASSFDKVMGGFAKPGPRFCQGVARAFGIPVTDVFRLAGLLPKPAPSVTDHRPDYGLDNNLADRLETAFALLNISDQELVVDLVERLAGMIPPRIIGEEGE